MNWKWNNIQFEANSPWAIARCELKVKHNSVWSYRSSSYCSLRTERETTFSLKLLIVELSLVEKWKWNTIQFEAIALWAIALVKWKWNTIQFEAIAVWAIARCEMKVKQHSVWSYRSLSYRSLWNESETTFSLKLSLLELSLVVKWKWNKIQFEAIAPWAIARCEMKVKQHSVWSYRSLSYRSLWNESETTFSLKLSLLELSLVVKWKWNNIQFEAIAPWAIARCEMKVKQNSVWSYRSLSYRSLWNESETTFSLKLSLLELSLVVKWVKQNSVWIYCSLSYRSSWNESETTFSLKLLLLELTLVVKWKWNNIQFEAIAPWTNARREMKVKQSSVWSYCSLSYRSSWNESETKFSLKLLLLEIMLVVKWKWNKVQFEAIAPWANAREMKVKQS